MHTFNGNSCRIHFDAGLDGECHIVSKEDETEMKLECSDLVDFVANLIRDERISKLEGMDSEEILGIK